MTQEQFVTLNQVIHHLRQNRHEQEAAQLEDQRAKLLNETEAERAAAAEAVVQMCSVRVLGRMFVHELTLDEWYRLIDQLAVSVRPYRKRNR